MQLSLLCLAALLAAQLPPNCCHALEKINFSASIADDYMYNLQHLLGEILLAVRLQHCLVIFTDAFHHALYDQTFFRRSNALRPYYYVHVPDSEDLLAPHYQTVQVLQHIKAAHCDLHFITLLNGLQLKRFLHFMHRHRILSTRARFVLLHDVRILKADMLHIWSSLISAIFIKRQLGNRFSISGISYPGILHGIVVTEQLTKWQWGMHVSGVQLFPDKSINLKGVEMPVAVFVHVPMVMKNAEESSSYFGLEVEILRALAAALNFQPKFYEAGDSEAERWGRELPNGTYSGLIGQLHKHAARFAIGDLHLYKLYFSVVDLSWPHSHECLTFLTPESAKDDSWRTLIQPFSGAMWAGVLFSLLLVGTVFYVISYAHGVLSGRHSSACCNFFPKLRGSRTAAHVDPHAFRDAKFRAFLNRLHLLQSPQPLDLFDNFHNCILLTYSMLMYVALPRMPRNWPLRVLTGWYWLYCILVTVTYRASLTAILTNPTARITIDSLDELLRSRITTTLGEKQGKNLFDDAFDEIAREVGINMELIDDIYEVTEKIAKEWTAYYDNEFFLRHLRVSGNKEGENRLGSEVLHIMRDCVVHMPVAVGLEKNSPLKPQVDKYLQRLIEGGLIAKWLEDATEDLPAEERAPQEALMDLSKMWSAFVALAIGVCMGVCAIIAEKLHFEYVVRKHPLYDKYNLHLYYNFKKRFSKVAHDKLEEINWH